MADDLSLNSVSRFSKNSPRLHLEEHGHCEVPAGCGGVVLRWYDPSKGVPILLWTYWPTRPTTLLLNGVAPASTRPLAPPGKVVLAIHYESMASGEESPPRPEHQGLFMIAISRPESGQYSMTEESRFLARSVPDGSWRFSLNPPADDWVLPQFDDASWSELVERPLDPPRKEDFRRSYAYRSLTEIGARPLGLPDPGSGPIWVRKVLTIEHGER